MSKTFKGKPEIYKSSGDITDYFEDIHRNGLCSEMKYDTGDSFNIEAFERDIRALAQSLEPPRVTVPPEFGHVLRVLQAGIDKGYEPNGWLKDKNSPRMSHKENHDSMFHHLAESFSGYKEDSDSGIHPLLHLATRALMGYTRYMRKLESDRE